MARPSPPAPTSPPTTSSPRTRSSGAPARSWASPQPRVRPVPPCEWRRFPRSASAESTPRDGPLRNDRSPRRCSSHSTSLRTSAAVERSSTPGIRRKGGLVSGSAETPHVLLVGDETRRLVEAISVVADISGETPTVVAASPSCAGCTGPIARRRTWTRSVTGTIDQRATSTPWTVRGTHTVPPGAAPRLTRRGGGRARRSECDHAERPGAGGRHRRDRRAGLPRHRGPDRPPVRDGSRLGVPDCDRAAHRRPRLRSAVDRQRRSARRRAGTPRGDEASRRYCCGRRRRKAPTCWNIVHDPARPGGKGCRPGAAGGVRSSDRRGRRAPRTSMVRRAGRPDSQTDPRCGWPRDRTRRGSLSWPTSSRPRPVDSRPAR